GIENQSTTDNKPMAISAILIILFMITDSFRFVRLFLVGGQHINQGNGGVFHVVYDTIDFRDDIVIENLKDDGHDQTEYRGQKGYLNVPCDQGSTEVTYGCNFLEGH